jgi:PTH1 family peptidyl-tRNA hydrolase
VSGPKIVVGLGNPGSKYDRTRHNVGFEVIDRFVSGQPDIRFANRFEAEVAELEVGFRKVLVVKPMTFMNASGKSVAAIVRFYKIPLEDLLVICDDLSLPLGRVRIRPGGGDGGQKGLRDISRVLGTDRYPRMRMGIGDRGPMDAADFVLARFRPSERNVLEDGMLTALQAIAVWATQSLDSAMNRFNGPADPQAPGSKT